jgi:hypothetical protein
MQHERNSYRMADLISLLLALFSPTPDTQPKIIIGSS